MSDFNEALQGFNGVSIEGLEQLMKKTRNAIKEKEQIEISQKEEYLSEELKPYELRLKEVEQKLKIDLENIDEQINSLRENKKIKSLESQDDINFILSEYNDKRKELNLPIKTLRNIKTGKSGITRNRTGESHKYDIDWVDEEEVVVEVMIDKNPEYTFTINTQKGLHVSDVKEAMEGFGIDTRGDGMCRGVVNRIRKLQLTKRNENYKKALV